MATETSSIDDLLLGAKTSIHPQTPEHQELDAPSSESLDSEEPYDYDTPGLPKEAESKPYENEDILDKRAPLEKQDLKDDTETDDYGNNKSKDNEVIRERLARQAESLKRQHQAEIEALRAQLTANQPQAVQQASEGFQYDENSNQSWDQQLRQFVEHTVQTMTVRQQQEAEQQRNIQAQMEFEEKFLTDVHNFPDFQEAIVSVGAPITDPMVHATRGIKNPAAFLYAAAKRAPKELQRISSIRDPYAQIAEMGRLEASLRQNKLGTKAPRPLGRLQEDAVIHHKTEREPTIEDLIAKSDAKRRAQLAQRRR